MPIKLLVSDHGPHSPEKWAMETARMIFDIDPNSPNQIAAQKAQLSIAEVLEGHHSGVQERERNHLSGNAAVRLAAHHTDNLAEAKAEAEQALVEIEAVLKGTPWADRFSAAHQSPDPALYQKPRDVAIQTLMIHFMTAKHIEHSWHRDRSAAT